MSNSSETKMLGGQFFIRQDECGEWRLDGESVSFSLTGEGDFKRVISLLELPFSEVKSVLGPAFPFVKLIDVGLKHESDYWISLALDWVSQLSAKEALEFVEALQVITVDKKVSQRNRGTAKQVIKKLRKLPG